MTAQTDAIVLDARLRQSLVAIRSLGRRGLAVAALDTADDVPAFSSRWCRRRFVCTSDRADAAYITCVEEILERTGAPVVIPSHDGTIAQLRQHRARLERRTRLALASEAALDTAVNKERTLAVARRIGLHAPLGAAAACVADVPAVLDEIGLPAVAKPSESWLSRGSAAAWIGPAVVTTADEARVAVAEVERFGGVMLFQRLLTGRREAVTFLYANGEIHARFAQWARRTNPPLGGESVLRQSIAVPDDIGAQAERLVREIDLEGCSEVEFRRDAQGVPYLMEINPRLSASVEIAVRSGVDFPHLLWQWASGLRIDRVAAYRVGGWMRYLQGDLNAMIETLHQRGRPGVPPALRTAVGFGASFLRPMAYDYFDWHDPLPGVQAMGGFARDLTRRSMSVLLKHTIHGTRKRVAYPR
jgi:predicted ATP-grasp superfamily ATP-dependent carboligase